MSDIIHHFVPGGVVRTPSAVLALVLLSSSPAVAQDVCSALNGATVIAENGNYLGRIANAYDSDSVLNKYGTYGSKYSSDSIWNEYGTYGSEYSDQSPFDRYSSTPPAVVKRGKVIAYLTVNHNLRGAVNPHLLRTCDL